MFWDDMCGRPYNNKNKQDCLITVCACLYSNKQLIQDESNKRAAALSNSELHCQGGQLSKHMAASATPHSNSTLPIFGIVLWAEELDSNKIREKKEHPTLIGVATLVSISKVAASSHELVLMRLPQNIMMISKGMESNLRRKGLSQGKAPGDRRFHLSLSLGCVANQKTSSGSCWADSGLCSAALLTMACSSCTQFTVALESS